MNHLHHKVSALVDGELSPSARSRALAHARSCPQCRQEIAETLEVKRRLHKLAPIEVSDDLLRVVAFVAPARPAPVAAEHPPILRRVLVGGGSLSAVVIVLAYVVGAPAATQPRPVSPSVEEFAAEFAETTGVAPLSDPVVQLAGGGADPGLTSPIGFGTGGGDRWRLPSTGPSPAGLAPSTGGRSGDSGAAIRLLRKAVGAPRRIAFTGMRVVRTLTGRGVESSTVAITHVTGQGTRFDVPGSDSASQSHWFVPDSDPYDGGTDESSVQQLAGAYDLHMDGSETIDGRPASVVSASQDGQVSARFWIDTATGLLLRKVMYVDGRMVRWSGYTSFHAAPQAFMDHLPPQVPTAPATVLARSLAPALNDKGWTCPEWLTGDFRLTALHLVYADGGVMHADYTDGMSTVSVFQERGSLDPSSLAGFRSETVAGHSVYLRDGLPMILVWQSGDTVFTLVTDAPEQTARRLLASFPRVVDHEPPDTASRIGHGLSRLASAVTP